jgi:hypothetical protein
LRSNFSSNVFIFILLLSPFTLTGNFQNVFAANLTPVADLTGQWSGFAQFTIPGGYCEYTGNVNAYLQQDGNNLVGEFSWVATSSKSIDPEIYECSWQGQSYSDDIQGTISGSQLTLQSSTATFTGWYASSGIKLDIVFDDATIGITQLSPTGFTPPAFTPEDEPTQPTQEEKDSDGDGIPDNVDECIGLLEDYYGENEEDGCPEKDSDGDSFYDYEDKCIYDTEDFIGIEDGCPEAEEDTDGDSFYDNEDVCPFDAEDYFEFGEIEGCPETDSDGDNIYDSIDQCVDEPEDTTGDIDGCPNYSTEDEFVEEEFAEEEMMEETQQIFEKEILANLQVNKGSVTITTVDGAIVASNELKVGDTIQTGQNVDTNVKIVLEDGDGVINLQENTQLSTVGISLGVDEDLSYIFDAVEKAKNNPSSGGVDEDLSYIFDAVEKVQKKSIADQVDEALRPLLDETGLSEEEAYLYSTAFASGMLLGLIPAGGVGAALIATGYIIMTGGIYFEIFDTGVADEENQKVIFTPDAVLVPHGTEFTVTIENGKTKLNVLEGEVSVIPLDENNPITTVKAGNSISVSDNKVEETSLDITYIDRWWEASAEQPKSSGGCLIATATFGSELAPQVQFLREIRDNTVLSTASGTSFMTVFNSFYYSFSPAVADLERQNPMFKETVKVAITPLLSSLSLLQYVSIDSEAEMLGYGIGIILLNIGMYFVVPALIIFKLKNVKRKL